MMLMRKFVLAVLVVVFSGWSSEASAVPIEWTVASGGNGHLYEAFGTPMSWSASRAYAESLGGYLVTITSQAEQDFIVTAIAATWSGGHHDFKIGGYQDLTAPDFSEPAGGWRWVTGETWSYTNWNTGEPNNCCPTGENYLSLHGYDDRPYDFTWNDNVSLNHLSFIVEYGTPIPEPNTALLLGFGLVGLGVKGRRRTA